MNPNESEENREVVERELDYEVLEEEEGLRLDLFLNARMVWRSRSSIRKLIEQGKVRLKESSGRECLPMKKPSRRIKTGEVLGVTIPRPKRELEAIGDLPDLEIPVLYEDQWILVVDKPAGIPVHPGGRLLDRTVITTLNERYLAGRKEGTSPLKLCHRLDLETSGVLLIGKDPVMQPKFSAQFEGREVKKESLALVHGELENDQGEIDLPIGLAEDSRIHLKRGINFKKGQPARTGYKVEKRLPGFTLVRLRLFTGRHHQLRVHLSALGHPIVGDKAYGLDENIFIRFHQDEMTDEDRERLILTRQALHAARMTINHVGLEKKISFEAPLPQEIRDFMEKKS
ncbi:MAG: RluA family pseudouridine synthase [Planctomycetes bacterium]|nr:RluA family pseudouridine synthase [Planctomycetota bacterium]